MFKLLGDSSKSTSLLPIRPVTNSHQFKVSDHVALMSKNQVERKIVKTAGNGVRLRQAIKLKDDAKSHATD